MSKLLILDPSHGGGSAQRASGAKTTLAVSDGAPLDSIELEGEAFMHEIFRSQGMDLRESPRTAALVRDLVTWLAKGGPKDARA